jgi:ParB family chromosome partitioning protein
MAKKLLEKAGLIHLPAAPRPEPADAAAEGETTKAKTAPGSMLQFMTAQSAAVKEAEALRERLAAYDGALPVRRLDPATVRVSTWANRHADSFQDAAYLALKADIGAAGGNVQPIKVRPLPAAPGAGAGRAGEGVGPSNPPGADGAASPVARFEIVYGHRRHRACLELGLPVLAVVEDVAEQQLFEQMERENRARADLSAWEQGMMYARALDQGLYPSNRQLAQAIGRDLGDVGKALSLARLPAAVVQAFRSPLDLQYRWAKPLSDAQQRDPDGLVARARELKALTGQRSAKQIFDALVGDAGPVRSGKVADIGVRIGGRQVAVVAADERGHTVVRFAKGLDERQRRGLAAAIEAFLAGAGGPR